MLRINGDDGKERTKQCNRYAEFLYYCPYHAYSTVIAATVLILLKQKTASNNLIRC